MPTPTAGAKAHRLLIPAIEPMAPRALTVAPALVITPGVENFKTSQQAANCTEDEVYC